MLQDILFFMFMAISIINLVHICFYLVGANFYDIIGFKAQVKRKTRLRHQPYVTVLIPAHNEELSITHCLDSVRGSTMRNLEIIVIDDFSTDSTFQIVTDYIRNNPDFNHQIRLFRTPHNIGKAGALNHAFKRGIRGEFVMTLDADSLLDSQAIENAVEYFRDPKVAGVAANVRVLQSSSMLGILQRFEYMVGYRSKKFYSLSNSEFIIGGVASTYRYSVLKEVGFYDNDIQTEDIALSLKIAAMGNRDYRLVYGADVLAHTQGVQTFKALLRQRYRWKLGSLQSLMKNKNLFMSSQKKYSRSLTMYRIPMAFLSELIIMVEPFLVLYIIYLSFMMMTLSSFIGAYSFITLYLLWNLWPDEHMKFTQKLRMTAYAPMMYFLFYIMNFVQFTAVLRCVFNFKQVLRRKPTSAVWTSPERMVLDRVS